MSDSTHMERLENAVDKIGDKLDKVLSVVSDIRANEQVNEHRFHESDRRHDESERRIDEVDKKAIARVEKLEQRLEEKYATKESVAPIKRIMWWAGGVVGTAVLTAIIGLVLIKNPSTIIQKPPIQQQSEQPK